MEKKSIRVERSPEKNPLIQQLPIHSPRALQAQGWRAAETWGAAQGQYGAAVLSPHYQGPAGASSCSQRAGRHCTHGEGAAVFSEPQPSKERTRTARIEETS